MLVIPSPNFIFTVGYSNFGVVVPSMLGSQRTQGAQIKGSPEVNWAFLSLQSFSVIFCTLILLYSYTIVLLYYCTIVLPVFFYRQLSDPKLPLGSRSSSRQPEAKSRQQSTFRCPVLHSFFRIFFQKFFLLKSHGNNQHTTVLS